MRRHLRICTPNYATPSPARRISPDGNMNCMPRMECSARQGPCYRREQEEYLERSASLHHGKSIALLCKVLYLGYFYLLSVRSPTYYTLCCHVQYSTWNQGTANQPPPWEVGRGRGPHKVWLASWSIDRVPDYRKSGFAISGDYGSMAIGPGSPPLFHNMTGTSPAGSS